MVLNELDMSFNTFSGKEVRELCVSYVQKNPTDIELEFIFSVIMKTLMIS